MARRRVERGVPVVDPKALREVLEEEMASREFTQTAMADHLGMSQGHLWKLLHEKAPRLTRRVLRKLRNGLPIAAWEKLARAVLPPEIRDIFDVYTDWLARQLARFNLAHEAYFNHPFRDPRRFDRWPGRRLASVEGERRQAACEQVYAALRGPYTSHLVAFVTRLRREHSTDGQATAAGTETLADLCAGLTARSQLAVYRVMEPLADAETVAGGIEVSWYELSDRQQLAAYFKAATTRERILLQRDNDLTRAQELGALLAGGMEYDEFAETFRRAGLGELPPLDSDDR